MENVKMNKEEILEKLKNAWVGVTNNDKEMISNADRDYLNKYPSFAERFKKNFNFEVHPHPWFGNIENPSIVVLAINPGYSRNADELDTAIFKSVLDNNLKMFGSNKAAKLFDKTGPKLNGKVVQFRYSSVSEWWEKVFEGVLVDEEKKELDEDMVDKFYEKVGCFNLVGYQSKDASKIGSSYSKLPTTKAMIEYVRSLKEENNNRMFIFVWGKSKWSEFGFEIDDSECEQVNIQCSRNKYIRDQDLIDKIKIVLNNQEKICP